jgi:hypothetical protein
MPAAIPLIVYAGATYAGATVVVAGLLATVASVAVGAYEAEQAKKKARDAYNASLQDRTLTLRSAVSPRRVVLGRAKVGGTLIYADTVGTNQSQFDQILACCDGPIDAVEGYWLAENYFPVSGLSGDRPGSGQYANPSTVASGFFQATLVSATSFVLPNAPRSSAAADIHVDLAVTGSGDTTYTNVPVASVVGATVNLTAPVTGQISCYYQYPTGVAPLRIQFQLGTATQGATTWSGVATPNWGSTDDCFGVVTARTLMGWDDNIYQSGPPAVSLLVRGMNQIFDPRLERSGCGLLAGAVPGTPGTLPTNMSSSVANGLALQVVRSGTDLTTGLPYLDVRISGTTTAAASALLQLPNPTLCPAASSGQTWGARVGVKMVSGTWGWTSAAVQIGGYTSGASFGGAGSGIAMTSAGGTYAGSLVVTRAGMNQAGARLMFSFNAGAVIDCTLRITQPQLWQGAVGAATDPTRWTSNPSLCAAWWMTRPRLSGGCGIPVEWIDWNAVINAANTCDELISVRKRDGTAGYDMVKRYECHTVLSLDASPFDNLGIILASMAGTRAFTAGLYRIFAGAYRAPTLTITDADVAAGQPIRFEPSAGGLDVVPNACTGSFADSYRNYVTTGATPVRNTTYIASDGFEDPMDLTLAASTDERQANYLMGLALERARPGFVCTLTVTGIGADIALVDGVMLGLQGYEAFSGVTWEVRQRSNNFNGTYTLKLAQTRSSSWSLDPDRYLPTNPPASPDLSYLWNVAPIAGFVATPTSPSRLPDGTSVMRIACTWTLHSQAYVLQSGKIEIRWRKVDEVAFSGPMTVPGSATSALISLGAVNGARYVVQARAVNGIGAYSEWTAGPVDANNAGVKVANLAVDVGVVPTPAIAPNAATLTSPNNFAGPATGATSGTYDSTIVLPAGGGPVLVLVSFTLPGAYVSGLGTTFGLLVDGTSIYGELQGAGNVVSFSRAVSLASGSHTVRLTLTAQSGSGWGAGYEPRAITVTLFSGYR